MFIPENIKGFDRLDAASKELFKRFCTRFYEAWEYPEDHAPTSVKRLDSKYLKVTLNDGDWLHVLGNGDWY
jgi:hypothetical protein